MPQVYLITNRTCYSLLLLREHFVSTLKNDSVTDGLNISRNMTERGFISRRLTSLYLLCSLAKALYLLFTSVLSMAMNLCAYSFGLIVCVCFGEVNAKKWYCWVLWEFYYFWERSPYCFPQRLNQICQFSCTGDGSLVGP